MKNKLWLFQLPFILLCTFSFYVTELGVDGKIENRFLRETLFPRLRSISTVFSDLKFRVRGTQKPKNKIVIVSINSESIAAVGRWPWHRDVTASLINYAFKAGAKVVGLDMWFSEPDPRLPERLTQTLVSQGQQVLASQFDTDAQLTVTIAKNQDHLVLGWTPDGTCQPLYDGKEFCDIQSEEVLKGLPADLEKFSIQNMSPTHFDLMKSPLLAAGTVLTNILEFSAPAKYSGYVYTQPDLDGVVRRTPLVLLVNGKAYPSLPFAMAAVGLNDSPSLRLGEDSRIERLSLTQSGQEMAVSPVGAAEINFRGGRETFPYVSAMDLFTYGEPQENLADASVGRNLASLAQSMEEKFKDAYVLIGVTALGVFDMRAFPFDSNVAGVEGNATILDNVLSHDFLTRGRGWTDPRMIYLLMVVGGLLFAYFTQKLEAIPALAMTLLVFGSFGVLDAKVLFQDHNINWNLSFLFIEFSAIFIFTLAAKYVMEEQSKKFVRGAFAKYVAPAVVDSILKDPSKLQVGGERRDLTILFSDIRGFTTFSEKMDAKALAAFLNDYLGIMTKIIFANEGTLDKYIGDAIMAFWGAPLDQPKHAINCCRTAVQMMQALAEHRERFLTQYGVEVDIGIGLNTGSVSVGNMGSTNNFAYTVIGDHVNLASRLEGLTKYYGVGILTSRFTFDSMLQAGGAPVAHRVLDFVKVKGKKNAVELIQVVDRMLPVDGLKIFEEARHLYVQQKWQPAIALFKKADELLGGDGPSRMYIHRCEEIEKAPLGPAWDGSWEMLSK